MSINAISYLSGNTTYQAGMFKRGPVGINMSTTLTGNYYWWGKVNAAPTQFLIYTDSYTTNRTSQANAIPTAWSTPDLTDQSLINLINTIPERVGEPLFTTVTQAVNWLNQTNKYFLTKNEYENIVTDGLVLNLDAGWYDSYPGSGSSFYDISGNLITSTLYNGVGFSGNDNGYLTFDGADDYGNIGQSVVGVGSSPYSVVVWCKRDRNNAGYEELLSQWTNAGSGNSFFFGFDGSNVRFSDNWNPVTIPGAGVTGEWMCLVGVNSGSNAFIYLNGVLMATLGGALTYSSTGTMIIGRQGELSSEYFDGSIAIVQIYNRALSSSEVIENFNAQRYRFGINNDAITGGQLNYLNSADPISYPGSGTSWKDLSGTQTNATLINGPSFDSTTKGITFDGSDDYATYSVNLPQTYTVLTVAKSTFSTWNSFSGLGSRRISGGFIMHNNTDTTNTTFYYIREGVNYVSFAQLTPSDGNIQRPHFYAMSTNGRNLHKAYIDSNISTTNTASENLSSSSGLVYLAKDDFIERYNGMTIYKHMIYDRQLSDTEILQNYYQGAIVTDNLQLLLDGGNRISYDATGTAWYDLTPNLNNATLINGPTFDSTVGGNIYFDGTNDYVDLNSTTNIRLNGNYSTVSMWCYIRSVGPNGYAELYFVWNANRTGIKWQDNGIGMDANGDFYNVFVETTNSYNQWMNITCVIDRVNSVFKVYKNGVFIGSDTFTSYSATSTNVSVGGIRATGNSSDYIKGSISNLMVYNVELDLTQISNNFNAQKNRYGL